MMTVTKTKLKATLVSLYPNAHDRRQSVEAWLVRYLCDTSGNDLENSLKNISLHGCISGAVSPLIYYSDCIQFYNKFSVPIWDKIEHFLDITDQSLGDFLNSFTTPLDNQTNLKTNLSWFAVEEASTRLLEHMGLW